MMASCAARAQITRFFFGTIHDFEQGNLAGTDMERYPDLRPLSMLTW